MSVIDILSRYSGELGAGLWVTLKLCLIVWLASFVVGGVIGVAAARWRIVIGIPAQIASMVLAGVPAIVFLFWMYYPAQALLGVVIDPFITAAFALSILGIFMVSDSVRRILVDFPAHHVIAAQVAGLTKEDIFWHIKMPIILRQFLPTALFVIVTLFQMSLFSSFISVDEVFRVAQRINSVVYRPVEIFTALAFFCVLFCTPFYMLSAYLRAKYTRDFSER